MRKRRKSWNWSAIIIVAILVSSTFAVTFYGLTQNSNETQKYNGYKFIRAQAGWLVTINGRQVFFNAAPSEVENLMLDPQAVRALRSTPEIDVTSSLNDTNAEAIAIAEIQMEQVLGDLSRIYLRRGFLENTSYNLPVITCSQPSQVPVIYFRTGLNTSFYSEGSCLVAEAETAGDMLKLKDRIIYAIYGVIP
ncbi:hypothetical protein HYV81_04880 [Candidatus Woesearchaeota archaeon]|nr:hypothetical protein [Candidatus Woesearchaeota archaeon]